MTIADLTAQVRFVTDANGTRQAVQLDLSVWEEIMAFLEEFEDDALNQAMDEAMSSPLLTKDQALAYLDQD